MGEGREKEEVMFDGVLLHDPALQSSRIKSWCYVLIYVCVLLFRGLVRYEFFFRSIFS